MSMPGFLFYGGLCFRSKGRLMRPIKIALESIQTKKLQAVYQAILPFIHFEGQYTEVFWFIK